MGKEPHYQKLRGRITEKCGSIREAARQSGISYSSLRALLNGTIDWNKQMMAAIARPLKIPFGPLWLEYFWESPPRGGERKEK